MQYKVKGTYYSCDGTQKAESRIPSISSISHGMELEREVENPALPATLFLPACFINHQTV